MQLRYGLHLAYCTNVHRGERWGEILAALEQHVLAVRAVVCPQAPFAIGLRLGAQAAAELGDPATLLEFNRWLDRHQCYVFTINGFPYGPFHGTPVKEQVYQPDWTTPERLEYTVQLLEILAQLLPPGMEGSVSTVPVSFKPALRTPEQEAQARRQLWACVDQAHRICRRYGRNLHVGLEPEPMCALETTRETVEFFARLRADRPGDTRLEELLGVNYDCCHLAIQFEDPRESLEALRRHGIRLSKIHLSNALKVIPTPAARAALRAFVEPVYLHQVVAADRWAQLTRYLDLPEALAAAEAWPAEQPLPEWRIHFHVPLHQPPDALFGNTSDHVMGVLDYLSRRPNLCAHLEMETYTWEVMPPAMRQRRVEDQIVSEYRWTLAELQRRQLA
ncbi:metabolite traffic protein EboE [Fontisphaera persica]|uniref:metabolite traffic protein EboE n=1 Tax=Fontisphaera persica TaxID=2974023 RepID=UPI0024C093B2|nr:metabolite traffic protein EboE [Fontisphaera persica]WCJ59143.1 metabolite traffic protein EboE [Fontisphaera persica]